MGKARSRPELYYLLATGMKPSDLIRRGVPVTTAYTYSGRFKNTVKKAIAEMMNTPPCSDEQLAAIMMAHKAKYTKRKPGGIKR